MLRFVTEHLESPSKIGGGGGGLPAPTPASLALAQRLGMPLNMPQAPIKQIEVGRATRVGEALARARSAAGAASMTGAKGPLAATLRPREPSLVPLSLRPTSLAGAARAVGTAVTVVNGLSAPRQPGTLRDLLVRQTATKLRDRVKSGYSERIAGAAPLGQPVLESAEKVLSFLSDPALNVQIGRAPV
jgi:hypothetical protein